MVIPPNITWFSDFSLWKTFREEWEVSWDVKSAELPAELCTVRTSLYVPNISKKHGAYHHKLPLHPLLHPIMINSTQTNLLHTNSDLNWGMCSKLVTLAPSGTHLNVSCLEGTRADVMKEFRGWGSWGTLAVWLKTELHEMNGAQGGRWSDSVEKYEHPKMSRHILFLLPRCWRQTRHFHFVSEQSTGERLVSTFDFDSHFKRSFICTLWMFFLLFPTYFLYSIKLFHTFWWTVARGILWVWCSPQSDHSFITFSSQTLSWSGILIFSHASTWKHVTMLVCPCNWITGIMLGALCPQPWPAGLVWCPRFSFLQPLNCPAGDQHFGSSSHNLLLRRLCKCSCFTFDLS